MRRFSLLAFSFIVTSLLTVPAFADDYKIDSAHSTILFSVTHSGLDHIYGLINDKSGKFSLDATDPTKSVFEFSAKTASIDTGIADRDKHLRTADFFSAVEYPEITFKSTSVTKDGDNYKVTGKLTLHGVTKDIDVVFKKIGEGKGPQGDNRIGFETEFSVKRSDYGMGKFVPIVSDEVRLTFSFQGIKS